MNKKIQIKELYKSFGPKSVLEGISLDVYEGEVLCIIGKSGIGNHETSRWAPCP